MVRFSKVVVPASHRLAGRRTLRPADLGTERIVVAPAGSPHRTMLAQLLRASRTELHVAVEASGWELMLHFARSGVGLAVVNDFCPAPSGMVGIPLEGAPEVTYYLVERSGFRSLGAAALRDLILETARA